MKQELYDKIRNVDDIKKLDIDIPEWGVIVGVHSMSGLDRAMLLNKCIDNKTGSVIQEKFQAGVLIACCRDPETGERLFSDGDAEWLMQKSSGAIEKLASAAMSASGLTGEALKEAEKNSSKDIPK